MKTLVKFCKKKHNILDKCRTIRFGTFEYYRKLDPSFAIADETEGKDSLEINSVNTSNASPEAIAALAPINPVSNIKISNIRLNVTFPNCYIWCCTRLREPVTADHGSRFDPEYDSFYKIPNATRFAEYLLSLLMTNITRTAFKDCAREKVDQLSIAEMGKISLTVFHNEVMYVDEKISTIEDGQLNPYIRQIPQSLRTVFVKPSKYFDDREYRFVFLFQHRWHGSLHVCKDPVDLPIIPI